MEKHFRNLDEQIDILKNKGLIIEDEELAKEILLREHVHDCSEIDETPTSAILYNFKDQDNFEVMQGSFRNLPRYEGKFEKVENGRVYTIEGNSSDSCRRRDYDINSLDILGYGTPLY